MSTSPWPPTSATEMDAYILKSAPIAEAVGISLKSAPRQLSR
ncbi:hypothetical protein ACVWXN_006805 [Bradyrhizobium sp. i1.4.4]